MSDNDETGWILLAKCWEVEAAMLNHSHSRENAALGNLYPMIAGETLKM